MRQGCQRCTKTHDYMRAHCHTHEDITLRTCAHTQTDVCTHKRTQIHTHARTHVCEKDRELLVMLLRNLAGAWLLKAATCTCPKCCCCTTSDTSPRPDIMPVHTYISMYIYICMCVCIYLCMCVHINVYIYMLWERISRTTSTTLPNRLRLGPKLPSSQGPVGYRYFCRC